MRSTPSLVQAERWDTHRGVLLLCKLRLVLPSSQAVAITHPAGQIEWVAQVSQRWSSHSSLKRRVTGTILVRGPL